MTDASTRRPPGPFDDDPPFDLPPPPPPLRRRRAAPSASWTAVALIAVGSFMANLAIHGRLASAAGLLATVIAGLLVITTPGRRTASAIAAVVLAVVVASNLVLRASDWVAGPTLAAVLALLGLAAVDQLTDVRLAVSAEVGRAVVDVVVGSVRYLISPVVRWLGPADERRAARLRGGAVAVTVALLLTLLLANADAVVGRSLEASLRSSAWSHLGLTAALAIAFAAISVVSHVPMGARGRSWQADDRPIEALMGLAAMAAVLAMWVAVQTTIALGGADRLLATASVTRAEYAREGFFELVAVVTVVLALLALFGRLLGPGGRRPGLILLGLVGALGTALVAITFSRLVLYIDAFGLTMLRLSVAWFLGWLALLVIAVTARSAGVGEGRAWLAGFVVITAAVVVVAYGWSNPEAMVASTNLDRDNAVVRLDVDYLESLGPDAASTLADGGITPGVVCPADTHPFGLFGWNRAWADTCPTAG